MNKKYLLTIVLALSVCTLPLMAVVSGKSLTHTLKDLCAELQAAYQQRSGAQQSFDDDYQRQHKRMIDVITQSDKLSILLYTQEQEMTLDLAFALKKVTANYKDFSKDRRPYDHIVAGLNYEIDRNARLIEALRRLPPRMKEEEITVVPDSLLYRNDSLDAHMTDSLSVLEREVIRIAFKDSLSAPFVLDSIGEALRDSCIYYASEMLKMNADNRAKVVADSTHYQEAFLRLKENYDYAQSRYQDLERYIFLDGQTPFLDIMANPGYYWRKTKVDLRKQYSLRELYDALKTSTPDEKASEYVNRMSSRAVNTMMLFISTAQIIVVAGFWLVTLLVLWLLYRYTRLKRYMAKRKLSIISLLIGTIAYYLILGLSEDGVEYIDMGTRHVNTVLWLLVAISGSLLLRVKPEQFRQGFLLYSATFLVVMTIVACRITFMPDKMMVLLFPPVLLVIAVWQLCCCYWVAGKATSIDSTLGWVSLAVYLAAFLFAFFGYTFVAMLILVWWYFLLAVWLTVVCIVDLLNRYKERWLDKRVANLRNRITYVSGEDRESLLFGATWFYDFIRQVAVPAMMLLSLPLCATPVAERVRLRRPVCPFLREPLHPARRLQRRRNPAHIERQHRLSVHTLLPAALPQPRHPRHLAVPPLHGIHAKAQPHHHPRQRNQPVAGQQHHQRAALDGICRHRSHRVEHPHRFARTHCRRTLGWYRSGTEGHHQQLHLWHPAHERTTQGRRLD